MLEATGFFVLILMAFLPTEYRTAVGGGYLYTFIGIIDGTSKPCTWVLCVTVALVNKEYKWELIKTTCSTIKIKECLV